MDPAPPDSKRQRLSWSAATPSGVTLPPPHHSVSHHPPPQLPRPLGLATINTHPHPGPSPHHAYSPRSGPEPSPAPPIAALAPSYAPQHQQQHYQQHHQHPDADRRHHDQEPYAPMQDPYRQPHHHHQQRFQHQGPPQPPSPVRSGYPTYPRRDSSVKRETYDHPGRSRSIGHASDTHSHLPQLSSAPQAAPTRPSAAYLENQTRHMSLGGSPSVTPAPGAYRSAPFPPPAPISQESPYEQHHGGYPSTSEPFYSLYSAAAAAAAKKKNTRASQACDQCRQLKAKCDETKPCKTCRDKGTECRYRDPIPKATDKTQVDILEGISAMQSSLATLNDNIGRIDHRLNRIEGASARPAVLPYMKLEHARNDETRSAPVTPFHANGDDQNNAYYGQTHHHDQNAAPNEHAPQRMMVEDEMEAEPGPPVAPGEPAIPMNHTTLAGLLLEWPSIRELTKHHLETQGVRFISEFPISQEQSRGALIVYGRGEDSHYSRQARVPTDHGSLDMADDLSDTASPSPAADFGHLGGLSPPDQVEYKGGVLGIDGNPDFSESKVWQYVESFKENILNMHPIVQPKVLDDWVREFLDHLPTAHPRSARPPASKPAFAVGGVAASSEATGSKRKRSPGPDGSDGPSTPAPPKVGKPNRSVHSALILTVLALGKVCLYRDRVPDVVSSTDSAVQGSPSIQNGLMPSPTQGSPPGLSAHSHSSGQLSPIEKERGVHNRRSSSQGMSGFRAGYSLKKNYEVIPGLEYFAYATDILGNHAGSYNSMRSIYANIFAGLYQGQLGRPIESFAFIHTASHKLQVLMRPSLNKLREMKRNRTFIKETRYNQLALAFWTCLQLESDLIAELPLPPSGLLSYEDDMPHPNMSLLQGFDQRVLDSYPGQLYLRTHLNSIHRMFYAPEDPNKMHKPDKFKNVGLVSDAVSGMEWAAASFAFKEDDLPADDILGARLRAKYWGAQGITYRPFIRQILQFSHSIKNNPSSPGLPPRSEFREDIIAPVIQPGARTLNDIAPEIVALAKKGIKALIESTRAFHGLGEKRPIITNVFGTAHAQWGNLLQLSAAFRDPVLHSHVDEDTLRGLFQMTIQFLRQSAPSTSSLRIDMNILEGLQRDLFHGPDPKTNSSFSSQTSAPTPMSSMAAPPHMQQQHQTHTSVPYGD